MPLAIPKMLRKSTAFVPRYQRFESVSLQQTVRLSPASAFEGRVFRLFARVCRRCEVVRSAETGTVRRHGLYRRQCLCRAKFQYRSASDLVQGGRRFAEGSRSWLSPSSEAQHPPLLVPGERQTRSRQQLVRSQIARFAAVKNGLLMSEAR